MSLSFNSKMTALADGFIYARQPRANGYGYIAVRNAWNHEPYGTFK